MDSKKSFPVFFLYPFIIWLIFFTLQLVCSLFINNSFLVSAELPLYTRLALFVIGSIPLLLLLQCSSLLLCFFPSRLKWIQTFVAFIGLYVLLFYYFASYISLATAGNFIGYDIFLFLINNPILLLQQFLHIQSSNTVWLFGGTLILTIFSLIVWPQLRKVLIKQTYFWRRVFWVFVKLLLISFILANAKIKAELGRTDPLATLLLVNHPDHGLIPVMDTKDLPFRAIYPPIVSLEHYTKAIAPEQWRKKNVIVILVESLRPDQLQTFGGSQDVMPNVDALARQSTLFTNTYAQSTHSNYADVSPFSSQYPLRTRTIYLYPKKAKFPHVMIYDILHQLGYKTAIFSSQNEYWGSMYNYLNTGHLDRFFHSEDSDSKKLSGKIDDRVTIDEAIKWLGSIGQNPFFMYINLQSSHMPYVMPDDFPRRFGPQNLDFDLRFNSFPPEKVAEVKGRYSDSLSYMDSQIGRLLQFLKDSGQLQDTLIILTGDNGQAFLEHGFAAHASYIYEEAIHVPMIFYIPWKAQLRRDERPAQHIDIAPTILALLNLPPHPAFQGINLAAETFDPHRTRFLVTQSPLLYQYAVVKDEFKYLWTPQFNRVQLFDLKNDPAEKEDVSKKYPEKTKLLSHYLRSWANLQLNYYSDPEKYSKYYSPLIIESLPSQVPFH